MGRAPLPLSRGARAPRLLGGVLAFGFVACGGPQKLGDSGSTCFRDDDCVAGLVCVAIDPSSPKRTCTSDPTPLISMVKGPDVAAGASTGGGAGMAGAGGGAGSAGVAGVGGAPGAAGAPMGGMPMGGMAGAAGSSGGGGGGAAAGMAGTGGGGGGGGDVSAGTGGMAGTGGTMPDGGAAM